MKNIYVLRNKNILKNKKGNFYVEDNVICGDAHFPSFLKNLCIYLLLPDLN